MAAMEKAVKSASSTMSSTMRRGVQAKTCWNSHSSDACISRFTLLTRPSTIAIACISSSSSIAIAIAIAA
jgi:hypothetical protein